MLGEFFSGISNAFSVAWNFIAGPYYDRILEIIKAPSENPQMLWMLVPIIFTLLLMEFYFGRYKEEELGWNTAFGNAIVLMFVAIDLFRHTYEPFSGPIILHLQSGDPKILISAIILLMALIVGFIDFFHFIPKRAAYIISSPSHINMIALLGIVIVYSINIPLDWLTFFACILIFLLANILSILIYMLIPSYHPPLQRILQLDNKDSDKKK